MWSLFTTSCQLQLWLCHKGHKWWSEDRREAATNATTRSGCNHVVQCHYNFEHSLNECSLSKDYLYLIRYVLFLHFFKMLKFLNYFSKIKRLYTLENRNILKSLKSSDGRSTKHQYILRVMTSTDFEQLFKNYICRFDNLDKNYN